MKYKVNVRKRLFGRSTVTLTPLRHRKNNPWGDLALIDGDVIEATSDVKHIRGFSPGGEPYNPDSVIDLRRDF
jgi:hypothetical protein